MHRHTFAHAMTVEQPLHLQNVVLITMSRLGWPRHWICIEFLSLWRKIYPWNGSLVNFWKSHEDDIKWKHFPRYWPFVICAGNSPASGEFPAQRPVTQSFDTSFDLCVNKRLRKQSRGWWFEALSCPLWRHRNGALRAIHQLYQAPSSTPAVMGCSDNYTVGEFRNFPIITIQLAVCRLSHYQGDYFITDIVYLGLLHFYLNCMYFQTHVAPFTNMV